MGVSLCDWLLLFIAISGYDVDDERILGSRCRHCWSKVDMVL